MTNQVSVTFYILLDGSTEKHDWMKHISSVCPIKSSFKTTEAARNQFSAASSKAKIYFESTFDYFISCFRSSQTLLILTMVAAP